MLTRIHGARSIDPLAIDSRASDGGIGDVWIRDDRLIERPSVSGEALSADVEFDASGCIAMAGGIDLHTHIGGGKITLARMLLRDQMPPWREAGSDVGDLPADSRFLPSAGVTASRYLDMGYTTCLEPAVIPCNARSAHAEMADVRGIDTGGYCLLGNDDVLLQMISEDAPQEIINAYVAWMVTATRCLAVKVVNPGGISAFKFNQRRLDVDTPHPKYNITPAKIIRTLCRAVYEIGLAHPLHVHCSNLGVPGNIASTLATIDAADGYPIHLTHAQFHCYGTEGPYKFSSAASQLVDAMRINRNVTIDVGQIMFGQTVTISADSMHQYENSHHAKPRKSVLLDIECEAGCGVVPFRYRRTEFVNSLQWAIGLELFLMIDDPSRVFLTTDHPNGGPFTAYPHLLGLLADRTMRETALAEIHPDAAASSSLAGIDRQYTLEDIAMMTRAAPAKILGLHDRGSLTPGNVADVVIYPIQNDIEKMFMQPRFVFKSGRLIRRNGKPVDDASSAKTDATLAVDLDLTQTDIDGRMLADFRNRYSRTSTFDLLRLRIDADEMPEVIGSRLLACGLRTEPAGTSDGGRSS
ncbi:formylmethanofuran dehydrogenase subunit A [Neorhodopirellula pilleata]|uniref:Formyltransferase/hydrolase complex Fhc subunit A n=1 Tax=Neorhodopirellula pilleata TaxID=2714738 RepID=A0A5C6A6Z7_9BACT|nr:formylmethanofuran dehydrogenase subunit A [Neorhodopirellula pilleata]TWT95137.1 Formyltransferase/hydrolase complex Fhc subunit A [Neorhodopirellula pilleata]